MGAMQGTNEEMEIGKQGDGMQICLKERREMDRREVDGSSWKELSARQTEASTGIGTADSL